MQPSVTNLWVCVLSLLGGLTGSDVFYLCMTFLGSKFLSYSSIFRGRQVLVQCLNKVFSRGLTLLSGFSTPLFRSLLSVTGPGLYYLHLIVCLWHWAVVKVQRSHASRVCVWVVCPWHIIILIDPDCSWWWWKSVWAAHSNRNFYCITSCWWRLLNHDCF